MLSCGFRQMNIKAAPFNTKNKQMKKHFITGALLIVVAMTAPAQNSNLEYNSALKLYNLTAFEEHVQSRRLNGADSFSFVNTTLQILGPTIAFQWKNNKNNFHEIELTNMMLGKTGTNTGIVNNAANTGQAISGTDVTTTALSVRYEYILNFNKSKDRRLVPGIGFGANPYFRKNSYVPKVSSSFPTSEMSYGMRGFLTPRISWFATSKLFFDVNIPICLFDTFYLIDNVDAPTLPERDRTVTSFNSLQFPRIFSGRLGVGLKL